MPDKPNEDAKFHEGAGDARTSEKTADTLDWRYVAFDLSNEVAFENIAADRWDGEAGKPAGLADILGSRTLDSTIEKLRKEPYVFARPVTHIAATGHYRDEHNWESSLELSQLTLEEYKKESIKNASFEWILDNIIQLRSLKVRIEEGKGNASIWRQKEDGTFHLVVSVDKKTMRILSRSLQNPDHKINLTLLLKGKYKSEKAYEEKLFFWLENEKGQYANYGDIQLTGINVGTYGGVSQEAWGLPTTNSIPQTQAEIAEKRKALKRYNRQKHLKKYWWVYLLGVLLAQAAIRNLIAGA